MASYIITGASRGLGLGIARAVAARGGELIAIARHESPALHTLGKALPSYRFIGLDLVDLNAVTRAADALFSELAARETQDIYLFNNAGIVEPIALAGAYDDAALARCIGVNLTATMQLGNAFVRHFQHRAGDKRMINISSGAARNPYPGWSAYCTVKAAVDMYSRCVGAEQASLPNGIRVAALAPGVVDTDMQADIRNHSSADFPSVARFHARKASGELADPTTCGAELLALMHSNHIGFGDLLDIRDFR